MIRNLVFEGGGVKGAAYAGALGALESAGVMDGVARVAGTSAGAITAMLVALRATAKEVNDVVGGTPFSKFKDDEFGLFRDAVNVVRNFGFYRGEVLHEWIADQVERFGFNRDLTFLHLADLGLHGRTFRELRVVATDLVSRRPVVFSARTTPDEKIADAVRASAGIPLYFEALRGGDGSLLVDGGISWNYPIDVFDDIGSPPDETLGFRLVGTADDARPQPVYGLRSYVEALLSFMLDSLNAQHVHESDLKRTVLIDALGVRSTDFDLSPEKVAALVESGRRATAKFLSGGK